MTAPLQIASNTKPDRPQGMMPRSLRKRTPSSKWNHIEVKRQKPTDYCNLNRLKGSVHLLNPHQDTSHLSRSSLKILNSILTRIFHFLGPRDLCQAQAVCRWWKTVGQQDQLWSTLSREHFGRNRVIQSTKTEFLLELERSRLLQMESTKEAREMLINGISISPNSPTIVLWTENSECLVWDFIQDRSVASIQQYLFALNDARISSDGSTLITISEAGLCLGIDTRDYVTVNFSISFGQQLKSIACSPTSNLIVIGLVDGSCLICNPHTKEQLQLPPQHRTAITHVSFSPNGRLIASISFEGQFQIHNLSTEALLFEHSFNRIIRQFLFSPKGDFCAVLDLRGVCELWSLSKRKLDRVLNEPPISTMAFSSRGYLALGFTREGSIKIFDPDSDRHTEIHIRQGIKEFSPITALAFSSNDRHLIVIQDYQFCTAITLEHLDRNQNY